MVRHRFVADIWSRLLCYNDLVIDQSLDLIFQRATFINGMSLYAGMVCTGYIWIDPLRRVFRSYSRDNGDITSSFEPFVQLVDRFSNGGILFGGSAIKIWSSSRKVLTCRR